MRSAVIKDHGQHLPIVKWVGARVTDTRHGIAGGSSTVLSIAATYSRHDLVQWLLEEGGAHITDVTMHPPDELHSLWRSLACPRPTFWRERRTHFATEGHGSAR
jgi:hypothetical protein